MIDANMLDEIKIASPDGVMFSDPNSAAVQPDKFPLLAQQPFTAAGNMLTIGVDSSQFFEAGIYEIFFEVKNPSKRLPNDNTWMTALLFDQQLLFTHVQPGYAFGGIPLVILLGDFMQLAPLQNGARKSLLKKPELPKKAKARH